MYIAIIVLSGSVSGKPFSKSMSFFLKHGNELPLVQNGKMIGATNVYITPSDPIIT